MKKNVLLSLLVVLAVFAFGQKKFGEITGPNKDLRLAPIQAHPDQTSFFNGEAIGPTSREFITIGDTWYDCQTYGNIMQRMWAYDDGSVAATWTSMGPGTPGVPDRGTGYNYFDNTSWGEPDPHVGFEGRMGIPCYAPWGLNGEIIVQYQYIAGEGPLLLFKREAKGVGEWDMVELSNPDGVSLVWQSVITSGDENEYIHILASTYDLEYMGQENALLYYRSSDGGETWDIEAEIIDGLGEDYFSKVEAQSYAWANPVGSTIAFTYGFDEYGGRVFRSNDHGDSWEMIEVFNSPFSSIDPPTDSEMFPCGIGSSAIALDSDGGVHVIFARMRKIFVDGAANWYPYTDGLIYWNETMDVLDTTIISSYTLDHLDAAGNLIGWLDETIDIPAEQPNYQNALWGFPQISIDAQDNMFVATSTISANTNDDFNYRHIMVNSSFSGGLYWEGQVDLTNDVLHMFSECAYPAMAPVIDDKVHIVYQEDFIPGIHEWLDDHMAVENQMVAVSYDKDFFVGNSEQLEQSDITLSNIYPNPANHNVNFVLKLDKSANVTVSVNNIVGQVVKTESIGRVNAGGNTLAFDVSDLTSGTYFCTIEIEKQKFSRKIVITR